MIIGLGLMFSGGTVELAAAGTATPAVVPLGTTGATMTVGAADTLGFLTVTEGLGATAAADSAVELTAVAPAPVGSAYVGSSEWMMGRASAYSYELAQAEEASQVRAFAGGFLCNGATLMADKDDFVPINTFCLLASSWDFGKTGFDASRNSEAIAIRADAEVTTAFPDVVLAPNVRQELQGIVHEGIAKQTQAAGGGFFGSMANLGGLAAQWYFDDDCD